tara:strand:+ start:903 stop:1226 length:324 start_codon:yes stop_codon:yes gene_type:complete
MARRPPTVMYSVPSQVMIEQRVSKSRSKSKSPSKSKSQSKSPNLLNSPRGRPLVTRLYRDEQTSRTYLAEGKMVIIDPITNQQRSLIVVQQTLAGGKIKSKKVTKKS